MLIRSAAMVPLLELFAPSGVELFVMAKRKHSRLKIATKLARANELATRGKLQSEIARTLGMSVMTLHRWRKALPGPQPAHAAGQPDRSRSQRDRIAELQVENSRLRQLVTDLLLEKIKLEEAAKLLREGTKRAFR